MLRNETITALHSCHDLCAVIFLVYNSKESHNKLAYNDLKLIHACMELCQITADFLLKRLPFTEKMCEICAEICEQCVASFAASSDEQLRQLAENCKHAVGACISEGESLRSSANVKGAANS